MSDVCMMFVNFCFLSFLFLSDGIYSTVGSFNFDFLSSSKNLEINVAIVDTSTAQSLEHQFQVDLQECQEITLETLKERTIPERLLHAFSYYALKILYSII